jgi:ankyrin repeat protein
MNLRDKKGRTPLHMAVAFNNKEAAETLMHLGASPHIEDAYGQRHVDICYGDGLKALLEAKMTQTTKLSKSEDHMDDKKSLLNSTKMSSVSSGLMTKEEKTYPLDIRDLKQTPKEKIIAARIGSEADNYLLHALKLKQTDLVKFLIREVPEIDLLDKNNKGMTALHLAIKSGSPSYVKLLFIKDLKNADNVDKTIKNGKTIDDIKGNIRT